MLKILFTFLNQKKKKKKKKNSHVIIRVKVLYKKRKTNYKSYVKNFVLSRF